VEVKEAFGHYTCDAVTAVIQGDVPPDDRGVRAECPALKTMTEDHDMSSGLVLFTENPRPSAGCTPSTWKKLAETRRL